MTRPPEVDIRWRIILPRVDFPLPLSPMSDTTSPLPMLKLTSRKAGFSPPPKVPDL
jgi:hypothetical protein